jgi:PAS domain S-box-containing protein
MPSILLLCLDDGPATEKKMKTSEVHYRRLFETAQHAILILNRDTGHILNANAFACSFLGYAEEEFVGKELWQVGLFKNRHANQTVLLELQEKGYFRHDDLLLETKTGQSKIVELVSNVFVVESTELIQCNLRDVAERRQGEEALKEANRRKDEFLTMLAHELRNPLAPIRNALAIVQMRGQERRQAVRQAWAMIERQVECLVRLVDDLLDLSRISRGKIDLKKHPVDMAIIVARAVECSQPLIDARRHELQMMLPDEPMPVDADVTRMAQVLLNLLNNAAKYTPERGRIWLTAQKSPSEIAVHVRDNGMGIPADILPRIFDLFVQAERTLNRADGGLGIGLTLVRWLTEMHGGRVEASSAGPGQGSEFVVRLPLLGGQPAAVAPALAADSAKGGRTFVKRRILVVDDNKDSADSLAMLLRLVGNDVRTVHDGRQALVVAEAYRPHLVLLDIGLPGLNGYEVARRLRAEPWIGNTTLVALTGYGGEDDRRRAEAAGFAYHMVKPVDFDALDKLLAALEPTVK